MPSTSSPIDVRPSPYLESANLASSCDQLTRHFDAVEIGSRLMFADNLLRQPAYEGWNYRVVGRIPQHRLRINQVFSLGVFSGLTEPMLDYIGQTASTFIDQAKSGLKVV